MNYQRFQFLDTTGGTPYPVTVQEAGCGGVDCFLRFALRGTFLPLTPLRLHARRRTRERTWGSDSIPNSTLATRQPLRESNRYSRR
jgi:hypothetical protein